MVISSSENFYDDDNDIYFNYNELQSKSIDGYNGTNGCGS